MWFEDFVLLLGIALVGLVVLPRIFGFRSFWRSNNKDPLVAARARMEQAERRLEVAHVVKDAVGVEKQAVDVEKQAEAVLKDEGGDGQPKKEDGKENGSGQQEHR